MIFYWRKPFSFNNGVHLGLGGAFVWDMVPITGSKAYVQCFVV